MKTFSLLAIFLCLHIQGVWSESLWNEDFSGYGTGKKLLEPGRILTVTINTETKLSFSSTSSGDRELVLTFSGGDTGNLFSFLPDIQSSERGNIEGEENISLTAAVSVRVQETNAAGMSYLQGSLSTAAAGAVQAVTVSGWCDPRAVAADGTVPFNRLADGTLTYRTFLESDTDVLQEEDIITGITELQNQPPADTTPGEVTAAADTAGIGSAPGSTASLSDEKKKELLLQYINQFVNIIFNK